MSAPPPLPPLPPAAYDCGTPPPPPPKPTSTQPSRTNTPREGTEAGMTVAPLPAEPFVPQMLLNKHRDDLQYLLHSPELLNALFTAAHPSADTTTAALTAALSRNVELAQHLSAQEHQLVALRETTQQKLAEAKTLERRWREKEKEMYQALQPFSSPALHARLVNATNEAEQTGDAMMESFLEQGGDVESFIRGYREVRKLAALRNERMGRWDEGRVGGWR